MVVPRTLLGLGATLMAAVCAPVAHAADDWSYELTPFAWTSTLNGQQAIGDASVDIEPSFSDLFAVSNIGGWLRFSARHEPWSLYAEVAYMKFEDDGLDAPDNTEFGITQTLAEAGVSYWFSDALSVYGGVRYQDLGSEILSGGVGVEDQESWVDGIVGAQWTPLASENWLVWLRADVGAGSSDRVWLAEAGVGYSWNEAYAMYLAYRLLDTEYQKDDFLYDMQQSGLMLGFGFRF